MKRKRKYLINIGLSVTGLLVISFVLEVVLRLTNLGAPSFIVPHGDLPFKWRANAMFMNHRERDNLVILNNWGFHDRFRSRTAGSFRFLAMGDSFLEGCQVPIDKLFSLRTEEILRSSGCDASSSLEFVNSGVGGTGTAYQYLLWKEFFENRIEVDHIVLFIYSGNDIPNNHPVLEQKVNGNSTADKVYTNKNGEVYTLLAKRSFLRRVVRKLDRISAVSYTVHKALFNLKHMILSEEESPEAAEGQNEDHLLDPAWQEAVCGTLRLIRRWHNELAQHGIGLSVVLIPESGYIKDGMYSNQFKTDFARDLADLSEEISAPFLKIDFEEYDLQKIFFKHKSEFGHFTELGHELVAQQTASWLLSQHPALACSSETLKASETETSAMNET
jgi:hypothetical protein